MKITQPLINMGKTPPLTGETAQMLKIVKICKKSVITLIKHGTE